MSNSAANTIAFCNTTSAEKVSGRYIPKNHYGYLTTAQLWDAVVELQKSDAAKSGADLHTNRPEDAF